ncbi:uncharacterized protein An12g01410 [Aspergillus niger]|uniref:Contig An12c0060, genomic contig n=2 Tax=Aspergillus niger TaxID=5061 RepID=A2QYI9_ASPNC|nr:uncharacterized protein An12g01410 [Aspergillus niger]CAK48424.1 unnamed protein product [Aspergillus niger]
MAYYCCLAKPMLAENPAIGEANADFSSMPPSAHSFARKIKLDWQNCLQTETESTAELLKYPEIEAVLYEHHINRERLEPIQENMLFWVLLPGDSNRNRGVIPQTFAESGESYVDKESATAIRNTFENNKVIELDWTLDLCDNPEVGVGRMDFLCGPRANERLLEYNGILFEGWALKALGMNTVRDKREVQDVLDRLMAANRDIVDDLDTGNRPTFQNPLRNTCGSSDDRLEDEQSLPNEGHGGQNLRGPLSLGRLGAKGTHCVHHIAVVQTSVLWTVDERPFEKLRQLRKKHVLHTKTTLNQKHANSLDSENLAVSLYYFTCEKPGTCRQYNMDTRFKNGSWLLVPGGEAHKGKTPQLRDANARAKDNSYYRRCRITNEFGHLMVAADTISTSTFRKELEIAWAASQTAILFGNHYILRRQSHPLQPTVPDIAKLLRFSLLAGYDLYVTIYYVECIVMASTGSIYWLINPDIQELVAWVIARLGYLPPQDWFAGLLNGCNGHPGLQPLSGREWRWIALLVLGTRTQLREAILVTGVFRLLPRNPMRGTCVIINRDLGTVSFGGSKAQHWKIADKANSIVSGPWLTVGNNLDFSSLGERRVTSSFVEEIPHVVRPLWPLE